MLQYLPNSPSKDPHLLVQPRLTDGEVLEEQQAGEMEAGVVLWPLRRAQELGEGVGIGEAIRTQHPVIVVGEGDKERNLEAGMAGGIGIGIGIAIPTGWTGVFRLLDANHHRLRGAGAAGVTDVVEGIGILAHGHGHVPELHQGGDDRLVNVFWSGFFCFAKLLNLSAPKLRSFTCPSYCYS
jgi:hypothetical protein